MNSLATLSQPGSAGVHIGQTDCPLSLARQLVGPNSIIGVSVGTSEEARKAVADGADYLGIGPVWPTTSKDVTGKQQLGPMGVGKILEVLSGTGVEAVAIGERLDRSHLIYRRNTSRQHASSLT
jgi:thiamine-phosphate diphosphorylase/hydroxyethylthiazole kinase